MAYDMDLPDRLRAVLAGEDGLTEKQMFGGFAFLVNGNMAVSASSRGGLMLRVDARETDSLVLEDGVTRFEMRGRAMKGWLHVDPDSVATEEMLGRWVDVGMRYARSLPSK